MKELPWGTSIKDKQWIQNTNQNSNDQCILQASTSKGDIVWKKSKIEKQLFLDGNMMEWEDPKLCNQTSLVLSLYDLDKDTVTGRTDTIY